MYIYDGSKYTEEEIQNAADKAATYGIGSL